MIDIYIYIYKTHATKHSHALILSIICTFSLQNLGQISIYNSARPRPMRKHVTYYSSLTWWRRQMKTFSALLALCVGNSPVTSEFPSQRPVTRSFGVFFDMRLKNGWIHNRDASDVRRYRTHYDVTVFISAGRIMSYMNVSVDPCEDFYNFACGTWVARTKAPEREDKYFDLIAILANELIDQMRRKWNYIKNGWCIESKCVGMDKTLKFVKRHCSNAKGKRLDTNDMTSI